MSELMPELEKFNNACDELVSGKYILFDSKIASILKIIAENPLLSGIVDDCLNSFDFNSKFNELVNSQKEFSIPETNNDIIAFVYNLLYRISTGKIDIYQFLSRFFQTDDQTHSKDFNIFAEQSIIPFKNAINLIYSKRHVITTANNQMLNCYNQIMATVKAVIEDIDNYKLNMNEKEEFTMLLNMLFVACENSDKKLVYTLMIGLDYFTKCHKKSRIAYKMLEDCFHE